MRTAPHTVFSFCRASPFAATNYAKKHGVAYDHNGMDINVSLNYKQQLRAYSKRQFDPFCRRARIVFPMADPRDNPVPPACTLDGTRPDRVIDIYFPREAEIPEGAQVGAGVTHSLVTTTGQLNFFRWAITAGIIDYAVLHRAEIEADMVESSKTRVKHSRSSSVLARQRRAHDAASSKRVAGPVRKTTTRKNIRVMMSFS